MNTKSNHILNDTAALTLSLSYEENVEALRCAQNIKKHLMNQVSAGKLKYQNNLEIINQVIESHRNRLHELNGILKAS